ncbi:hypothetical protein GOV11_04310 [Candidatus Woesearchaeota archaeon]|nr:hypothetical protein [Candidatus Woesearchaeota archaeon]
MSSVSSSLIKKEKESDIQKAIVQYFKCRGIFCWVNKTQGTYDVAKRTFRRNTTMKGIPDILGVMQGGRMLAIEVKSKTGSLTPEQRNFIENANSLGAFSGMCRSVKDAEKLLNKFLEQSEET